MRNHLKLVGSAVAWVALFSSTPAAGADPLLQFSALPAGEREAFVIKDRPASIPATSKVEGFTVRHPDYGHTYGPNMPEPPQYAMIFGSDAEADAHFKGFNHPPPNSGRCFESSGMVGEGDQVPWNGSLMQVTTIAADIQNYPEGTSAVQPVRSERIRPGAKGEAVLEVAYAWIDAKTAGVQLISKEEIPLKEVTNPSGGVAIYAYRSADSVHYVFAYAENKPAQQFVEGLLVSDENGMMTSSQAPCHAHATLDVKKGRADTATVRIDAILPPKKDVENVSLREGVTEFRARPMFIGLSASWLSADDAPVLSVTRGWAGPERSQFM